jgi:hypothetical protein
VDVTDLGTLATDYGLGTTGLSFALAIDAPATVLDVEDDGGTGINVYFTSPVNASAWIPSLFQIQDPNNGLWISASSVSQGANGYILHFDNNDDWITGKSGLAWRIGISPLTQDFNVITPEHGSIS